MKFRAVIASEQPSSAGLVIRIAGVTWPEDVPLVKAGVEVGRVARFARLALPSGTPALACLFDHPEPLEGYVVTMRAAILRRDAEILGVVLDARCTELLIERQSEAADPAALLETQDPTTGVWRLCGKSTTPSVALDAARKMSRDDAMRESQMRELRAWRRDLVGADEDVPSPEAVEEVLKTYF